MSFGLALNMMIIVNTVMSYVIKLEYVVRCHDVLLLRRSSIVNIASSYVINLHEQYVFFQRVAKVYVWLNTEDDVPQGGGFCNSPGENPM